MTAPHHPGPECLDLHCYVHHVDENDQGAYRVCGECFHVFRTARELRRAHRAVLLRIATWERTLPPGWASSRWRRRYKAWTARASRIWVCPHCAHDF